MSVNDILSIPLIGGTERSSQGTPCIILTCLKTIVLTITTFKNIG